MRSLFLLLYVVVAAVPVGWLLVRGTHGDLASAGDRLADLGTDGAWRATVLAAVLQAALAAVAGVVIGMPAAIGLALSAGVGRQLGVRLLWFAWVVPPALVAVHIDDVLANLVDAPATLRVALAHLLWNVPIAVGVIYLAASRLSPAVLCEARQDGLGPLARWRYIWWPTCRAACGLALLLCFGTSLGERAVAASLHRGATLATSVRPAAGSPLALADQALAGFLIVGLALLWAAVLGWWWGITGDDDPAAARQQSPPG